MVEGTHEAIIDRETFKQAQQLFNRNIRKSPLRDDVDLFSGLVRCADCHRIMSKKTIVQPYGTYRYYRCTTARKMNPKACTNHTIRIDQLQTAVTVTIQKMIETAIQMSEIIELINQSPKRKMESAHLQAARKAALKQKEKLENMQTDLYPDWKSGILDDKEYLRLKNRMSEQLKTVEQNIQNIENSIDEFSKGMKDDNDFLTTFKKFGNITELTRPMLMELVEKILVHENGSIEVCFKYRDSYLDAKEYITINENLISAG